MRRQLLFLRSSIFIYMLLLFGFFVGFGYAQEVREAENKMVETKPDTATGLTMEQLFEKYVQTHDYDGLYASYEKLLKEEPHNQAKIYFFMALTRQRQIAYWKEAKNWEGVYDKAPLYKKEILDNIVKAQESVKDDADLLLRVKYLKWQVVGNDDPEAAGGLFNDLVNTAREKVSSWDQMEVFKSIADEFSFLEDKNFFRRLNDVFLEKLSSLNFSGEKLKVIADEFLSQANVYLSKAVLELYFHRLSDQAVLASEMVLVADRFAVKDSGEALDPLYAEGLYAQAFQLGGFSVFSSSSQYRRAFNLERIKEYARAFDAYKNLLENYPDYDKKQEIYFRLGVLAAYAKKDIELACGYFLKLTQEYPKDIQSLSALYQLGLLNQWKGEKDKAKSFYSELVDNALAMKLTSENNEVVLSALHRLEEIKDNKEIKYSLRLFLGGIFVIGQTEAIGFLNVDVTAQPPNENADVPVRFLVTTSTPETGCMVPAYSYEWSGELGNLVNIPNSADLKTEYVSPSIKLVQVAVVGPQGVEGVGFEMVKIVIENNTFA